MADKEKIRKEVQRLMNELIQEKERGYGSDIDDACILELQNVLTYIDSLQEEPAPKMFEDMLNAKTAAESLGISQEEHDRIVDELIYGKEPELVDDAKQVRRACKQNPADIEAAMQEVEEKSKAFTEAHQGESFDEILAQMRGEEPVSEDLEEAANDYAHDLLHDDVFETFIAGSKWKEEQMMKDAVYGLVCGHDESSPAWIDLNLLNKPNIKVGTEVKLIIIKDE